MTVRSQRASSREAARIQRGLTLLECAAALAIAAVMLASTTHVSQAAAALVRRARVDAGMIDAVRNLLEHEIGAPCAAPFECPPPYRCAVTRSPVTAAADRVTASVTSEDGERTQELGTLAPVPACGS